MRCHLISVVQITGWKRLCMSKCLVITDKKIVLCLQLLNVFLRHICVFVSLYTTPGCTKMGTSLFYHNCHSTVVIKRDNAKEKENQAGPAATKTNYCLFSTVKQR